MRRARERAGRNGKILRWHPTIVLFTIGNFVFQFKCGDKQQVLVWSKEEGKAFQTAVESVSFVHFLPISYCRWMRWSRKAEARGTLFVLRLDQIDLGKNQRTKYWPWTGQNLLLNSRMTRILMWTSIGKWLHRVVSNPRLTS